MPTSNYNQCYAKGNLQTNKSLKMDPLEMEFYSLGVMLLEMLTLQSVQHIDEVLRSRGNWDNITNFRDAADFYGPSLVAIIHFLIDPPKDNSLTRAVQDYKQLVEENDDEPDYAKYYYTADRLQRYLKEELVKDIETRAQKYITAKGLSVREVFDVMARLDPSFAFGLTGMGEFEEMLGFVGVQLTPDELLFLSQFYFGNGLIRYFRVLRRVLPVR